MANDSLLVIKEEEWNRAITTLLTSVTSLLCPVLLMWSPRLVIEAADMGQFFRCLPELRM